MNDAYYKSVVLLIDFNNNPIGALTSVSDKSKYQNNTGWTINGSVNVGSATSSASGTSYPFKVMTKSNTSVQNIVSPAGTQYAFGSSTDFTIEFYAQWGTNVDLQQWLGNGTFYIGTGPSTGNYVSCWTAPNNRSFISTFPNAGGWYALVRSAGVLRFFFNGTKDTNNWTTAFDFGSGNITIGNAGGGGFPTNIFGASIGQIRITIGVARYTTNYIPPSAPYPTS